MSDITQSIMAKLVEILAPLDARVLAQSQVWAKERTAALREYKKSTSYEAVREMGQHAYYHTMFEMCGGKTWYNVFNNHSVRGIEEFVEKNCKAIAARRNASIAKKLEKAEVTEIVSEKYSHSNDGFNGVFVVNTNQGAKRVVIDTILAGGYNIQCLHLRVLVKVK